MAKNHGKYRELGVTIPTELEPAEWCFYVMCGPNDEEWYRAIHDAVRLLARGRFWGRDDRQSSIKQAQLVGAQIERSLMACNIDFTVLADAIKYLADNIPVTTVTQTNNNNQDTTVEPGGTAGSGCPDGGMNYTGDEPVTYIPYPEIDDPYGEQIPDNPPDTVGEIPPEGWPDWQTFIDSRCLYANYAIDQWIKAVGIIRTIENAAPILVGIIRFLSWVLPTPFTKGRVWLKVIEGAAWVLAFFNVFDRELDVLDLVTEGVEQNKQQAVCLVYNLWQSDGTTTNLRDLFKAWFDLLAAANPAEYDADIIASVHEFIDILMSNAYLQQVLDWTATKVPDSYVPSVNCAICDSPEGWTLVPAVIDAVVGYRLSSNATNASHVINEDGSIDVTFTGLAASRAGEACIRFVKPPNVGQQYRGLRFMISPVVNCTEGGYRVLAPSVVGENPLTDDVPDPPSGVLVLVREAVPAIDWPANPLETQYTSISTNLQDCDVLNLSLNLGARNLATGVCTARFSNFQWLRHNDTTCP